MQLTPPGSSCSIAFGTGLSESEPGSAQVQLVVADVHAAREELIGRGLDVGEVEDFAVGVVRVLPRPGRQPLGGAAAAATVRAPARAVIGPRRMLPGLPQLAAVSLSRATERSGPLVGQIDSRSAFAAACRRSLTSANSRAARSMRSCCASVRACWLSACLCWLSARSLTVLSCRSIAATVRVSAANWPAMLAMSASDVTPARVYAGNQAWTAAIDVERLREPFALPV